MRCAPKSRRQRRNFLCARGLVAAQTVARCSLCAAVATVVNAIAAPRVGRQLGGSSGAPPTVAISGRKRADTLISFASARTGSGTVGLA